LIEPASYIPRPMGIVYGPTHSGPYRIANPGDFSDIGSTEPAGLRYNSNETKKIEDTDDKRETINKSTLNSFLDKYKLQNQLEKKDYKNSNYKKLIDNLPYQLVKSDSLEGKIINNFLSKLDINKLKETQELIALAKIDGTVEYKTI